MRGRFSAMKWAGASGSAALRSMLCHFSLSSSNGRVAEAWRCRASIVVHFLRALLRFLRDCGASEGAAQPWAASDSQAMS
jgi:hypothetical protein